MGIQYLRGDATKPDIPSGKEAVLLHLCNNRGGWGAGFVLSLSSRWKGPEFHYRLAAKSKDGLKLGTAQFVQVGPRLTVINMIAQNGFSTPSKPDAVDYKALEQCLEYVANAIDVDVENRKISGEIVEYVVVGPKFGCGLAGGDWSRIGSMLEKYLGKWPIHIYQL